MNKPDCPTFEDFHYVLNTPVCAHFKLKKASPPHPPFLHTTPSDFCYFLHAARWIIPLISDTYKSKHCLSENGSSSFRMWHNAAVQHTITHFITRVQMRKNFWKAPPVNLNAPVVQRTVRARDCPPSLFKRSTRRNASARPVFFVFIIHGRSKLPV